jgi:hypothetical protein
MSDVHKLTIETRRPRGDDLGAVEIGYWIVSGDAVWLCDEDGVKTGDRQSLRSGLDPKVVAINLLRRKVGKRRSDFNRRLVYPKNFY